MPGRYPTTSEGLNALVQRPSGAQVWTGPYLKNGKLPVDPWGNPYQYRSPADRVPYEIVSFGADGREGGAGTAGSTFRTSTAEAQAGFTLIEVMAVMAIVALARVVGHRQEPRHRGAASSRRWRSRLPTSFAASGSAPS